MTPILGVIASEILGASQSSFEPIATVPVGAGGLSAVSFASIPQTYKHLQIRGILRRGSGSGEATIVTRLNGDTASNYAWHQVYGNASTAGAGSGTSQTFMQSMQVIDTANVFGAFVMDILDYTNANKDKTIRSLNGYDDNSTGYIGLRSGAWLSNSAVTSLSIFFGYSADSIAQYSRVALYGSKG